MVRLAVISALAVATLAAHGGAAPFAHSALAAAECAEETRNLKAFKRDMSAKKRRFFRSHRSAGTRRAFVRRQAKRLKALKRAERLCLSRPSHGAAPATPVPADPAGPPPPPPPPPGGLGGDPGSPALQAVSDVITDDALVAASEVTDGLVRTQVQLAFARGATVGQVNALLAEIDGRIVSSRQGVLIVVVEIPDPGSPAALEQLLASLADDPVLRVALPVFIPPADALPAHIAFGTPATASVRSQAAVRGTAAWNARAALAGRTPPSLVVADHFGDGPPGGGTDITPAAGAFGDNAASSDHGYMVLGITSGAYDATGIGGPAEERVTGMFPGRLPVRVADITTGLAGAVLHDRMLELIEGAPGDVVLNTSLSGWPCATAKQAAAYCTTTYATTAGAIWVEKVRGTEPGGSGTNLEGRFMHATSAGNIEPVTGAFGAAVNSEWTAAVLLPLQDAETGAVIPPLTNTLVVGNHTATSTEPFRPGCGAPSSEAGGTIAGVGSPIHSFDSPDGAATFADGGTSAATPQVAGVAAYVWALRPGLTPAQLAALLRRTTRDEGCGSVLDAYAALLAADGGNPARPALGAILDVADSAGAPGANGRFDGHDLDEFLERMQVNSGKVTYEREDLNGDGVTGAEPGVARRDRVDLDADDSFGTIAREIEGLPVRYDERSLSDENVLCFAGWSPLWLGPPSEREEKLGYANCTRPDLSHTFPDQVTPGSSNTLTITASSLALLGDGGDQLPLEDVFLQLEPSLGVTLGSESGTTDADGVLATNVTLAEDATALSIDVTAFDREGGEELASTTVTAQVSLPGSATIDEVTGQVDWFGGEDGENLFVESDGDWSLSGGGSGTSVSATASLETEGGVHHYTGSGSIESTWGGSGGAAGTIGSYVALTVSGGPVRWSLTQTVSGEPWPTSSFAAGCYVNGVFRGTRSGGGGGVLPPGAHEISFNCGAGAGPDFPSIDGELTWSLTVGD